MRNNVARDATGNDAVAKIYVPVCILFASSQGYSVIVHSKSRLWP